MATNYKVLGQAAPPATTDTNVYTCPASTETVVSSIVVANRSESVATFRIAVRPNGATIANSHYISFDSVIDPNDSVVITAGITLDASDIITVYASTANLSFNIFGSEIT